MADKVVKGPHVISSAFIEKDKKFLLVFCPKINPEEAKEFKWVTFEELKQHKNKEGALVDFFNKSLRLNL